MTWSPHPGLLLTPVVPATLHLDSDTVILEITNSGNNIRAGVAHPIVDTSLDAATTAYADWSFNLR